MENMVIKDKFKNQKIFWNNKNVLITGHSGFKGSWLTLWLDVWSKSNRNKFETKYKSKYF